MPLTEVEITGLTAIINYLSREDKFSLAKTVVNNLIAFENEQEAISAILSYTQNPMDFFKRKKVKKELIFRYAHWEKIPNLKPSLSRLDIVKAVLNYWGSNYIIEQMDDTDWNDPVDTLDDVPLSNAREMVPVQLTLSSTQQHQLQLTNEQQLAQDTVAHFEAANNYNISDRFNCWLDRNLIPSLEDQQLALEFCNWYYPILNSYATVRDDIIDTSPYFLDCNLQLLIKSPTGINSEVCEGSVCVAGKLKTFIYNEQINFNPNLNEKGLRCLSDQYGRKAIIVAGTIHHGSNVGLFEQQLGLVRDPIAEYNWKIKFSRLAITSSFLPNQEAILENTQLLLTL